MTRLVRAIGRAEELDEMEQHSTGISADARDRLVAAFGKASVAHCFTPAGLARIAFRTPKPNAEQQAAALEAARQLIAEAEAHHALPERAEAASWAGDTATWRRLLDEHRNTSSAIPWGWRETTLGSGAPFIHHGYYPRRLWAFRLGPITWFEAEIVGGGLTKLRARLGRATYELRRQDLLDRLYTPGEAIDGREYRARKLHFTARREDVLAYLERNAAALERAEAAAPDVCYSTCLRLSPAPTCSAPSAPPHSPRTRTGADRMPSSRNSWPHATDYWPCAANDAMPARDAPVRSRA